MDKRFAIDRDNSLLVIVDLQVKLMAVIDRGEAVIDNVRKLLTLSRLFNIPAILTEQHPKMLGRTVETIRDAMTGAGFVEKMAFDCCNSSEFNAHIASIYRPYIILTGVETHICIYQTALSLIDKGYHVHVVADAVGSRLNYNKETAIMTLRDAGAVITSTETIIFQILREAGTSEFKEMIRIVK